MLSAKNIELFSRLGVLSPEEQKMRFNAFSEDYIKRVEIEADTLAHMVIDI
jgi:glutamine synthetase type III